MGPECAIDRLLLGGKPEDAHYVASSSVTRLPISGGALIKRGLPAGPVVARTLREIEDQWVAADFPIGDAFEQLVADAINAAR
jgi:poly(A) polymerase